MTRPTVPAPAPGDLRDVLAQAIYEFSPFGSQDEPGQPIAWADLPGWAKDLYLLSRADALLAGPLKPYLAAEAQTQALQARVEGLEKDAARRRKALRPFTDLSFSFDGFSCEPAALVFRYREYGQWGPDHHAAFQKMIDAARAALDAQPTEQEAGDGR